MTTNVNGVNRLAHVQSDGSNHTTTVDDVYRLARVQSDGFFDDIHENSWKLLRERVRTRKNHCDDGPTCLVPTRGPKVWYGDNWEPDFTCLHERRIGGEFALGDGPKWVCDPHRIAGKGACLVYSFGSFGNFGFEDGVRRHIYEGCEIHTFDPELNNMSFSGAAPSFVSYHRWGLKAERDKVDRPNYRTMKQTVQELGHAGRTIDIFKIDCESCEWQTYNDWLDAGVVLRQILVEVHNADARADGFFETMQRNGYVTFHKEPNIATFGTCVEYAFLKLGDSFFDGMEFANPESQRAAGGI